MPGWNQIVAPQHGIDAGRRGRCGLSLLDCPRLLLPRQKDRKWPQRILNLAASRGRQVQNEKMANRRNGCGGSAAVERRAGPGGCRHLHRPARGGVPGAGLCAARARLCGSNPGLCPPPRSTTGRRLSTWLRQWCTRRRCISAAAGIGATEAIGAVPTGDTTTAVAAGTAEPRRRDAPALEYTKATPGSGLFSAGQVPVPHGNGSGRGALNRLARRDGGRLLLRRDGFTRSPTRRFLDQVDPAAGSARGPPPAIMRTHGQTPVHR